MNTVSTSLTARNPMDWLSLGNNGPWCFVIQTDVPDGVLMLCAS